MNKILVHQAFYGEVNRSHGCIKQTIVDPDLTTFLITFTDRPGALPPGTSLLPYLSGGAFSKYFVFTKTYPDDLASRAGMVLTHVLILDLNDVIHVTDLQRIFSFFVRSTKNKPADLIALEIDISTNSSNQNNKHQPRYIQQVITAFIKGEKPILFSGDLTSYVLALQHIWKIVEVSRIKFRASFSPTDIEGNQDLTVVSIQKEFLTKWQGRSIIQGDTQETVEITSPSELLLLGIEEETDFGQFLAELNVDRKNIQEYGNFEKIYNNYSRLGELGDANELRQDIRILTKISPSAKDGSRVKKEYSNRLAELISNGSDSNIKALRNINWSAFDNGEKHASDIVYQFVSKNLNVPNRNNLSNLSEVIALAIDEPQKHWWHVSIHRSINDSVIQEQKSSLETIWQLIDFSADGLKAIMSTIKQNKDIETILRQHIPEKLKAETSKSLTTISKKEKWYLLHADILVKNEPPKDVIEKQLEVEQKLPLSESPGVNYLANKLPGIDLIEVTLKLSDKKLIQLSIEAIAKDVSLLEGMDLSISCWLEIWSPLVIQTQSVFGGLVGREKETVFCILDLMLQNKPVSSDLFRLISETEFADISEYKRRSNAWAVLPVQCKEKFIVSSATGVLNKLLSGEIDHSGIEIEIEDRITSDTFVTKVLNNNQNNIDPIIVLYSSFGSTLKDHFLSNYIRNYRGNLSRDQADGLGNLVKQYGFSKSARSLYDKSRYNSSYTPAYEICRALVSFSLLETLFGARNTINPNPGSTFTMIQKQEEQTSLPTIVILTAIHEEYKAVKANLVDIIDADQNDTAYEAGKFVFGTTEVASVIIRECGARNTNASQETERAIQYFKPNMMLFVGIAGSRKQKDFSIGDVIFPDKIYSYEGGKAERDSFNARPELVNGNFALYEKAKKERGKNDWKVLIKGNWEQDFKADLGIIASGEQLIEHYDSAIGQILTKHYNDTSAVEMEGFGFAKAASRQGRDTGNIMIGVVRGISDIIEQSSETSEQKSHDRRPANAKMMASDTAAAFAFWLILKMYESNVHSK